LNRVHQDWYSTSCAGGPLNEWVRAGCRRPNTPTTPKDDTMKILHPNAPGYEGGRWLLCGDSLIGIPNPEVLKGLVDAGIPATGIDAAAWYFLLNSTNRAGRVLIRAEGDGTVWITDFVSKRHVTSPEDLTALLAQ